MSSGSYAASATTYGQNPNDSFYELGRPGVFVGPLEIDGNLTVDGTTTMVGAVTAQSGLTTTGGLLSGPPGLPLTFAVNTAGDVTARTYNGLNQLGVTSVIDRLNPGPRTYTWTGSHVIALVNAQIVTFELPADILTNPSYPEGLLCTRIQPGFQGGSTLIVAGTTTIYNISPGVAPLVLNVYLGTTPAGARDVYYTLMNNGGGIAVVDGFAP